jgi:peptide/nickel transport system substrate-binding protein
VLAGLGAAIATPAAAQTAAPTLNIGIGGAVTSADPHFYNAAPNNSLAIHIFDRLVERDSRARLYPGLAESWKLVSETTWEFKLRSGVKWHDGKDFSADDVAFTIARVPNVPNSPGGYTGFVRAITRVEVVDPLTIRFHTTRPHPLLPTELATIGIVSRHAGEGAATEDYNSGKAAIGTGPYRLASFRAGDRTDLLRNDAYFRGAEPWARVNHRFIANDGARTAALLAGDVDMIEQVPSSDVAKLRRDPRVALAAVQSLRILYLSPDFSREGTPALITDNDGRPLPRNPLQDLRVRQALTRALNRTALAENVMEGTAQPAGQWLPPGVYSHDPSINVPAFDPEGAKRLLAEAGFPSGFRMTLHSPNDRYPNDARMAQAVAQMWSRIGIRTEVEAMPWASFSARAARQEFGMRLLGWGSPPAEASYMLVNGMMTFNAQQRTGANNSARYSNPRLDTLTERAVTVVDDQEREKLLQDATRMVIDDVALIPMVYLVNTWALRRGLTYDARMDDRTLAMGVRAAP